MEVGIRPRDSVSSNVGFSIRFPLAVIPQHSPSIPTSWFLSVSGSRSVVLNHGCLKESAVKVFVFYFDLKILSYKDKAMNTHMLTIYL